jgi:CubicO group peptidase (beta-lactamase class C family)
VRFRWLIAGASHQKRWGIARMTIRLATFAALLCLGVTAATAAEPAANLDPARLRAIVQESGARLGAKAVEFGVWRNGEKIVTLALGSSMTTVPATTDMHYRIGGIAETFMSTLLLMLAEQGRIDLDAKIVRWFPDLLAADKVTVRMLVGNTAGFIDYVGVQDFLDLQVKDPFRTFTDA